MAHEIDQSVREMGAAYYAGEPAWHRLGIVTPDAKTSRDVIKLAGLDWLVLKQPIWTDGPPMLDVDDNGDPVTTCERLEIPDKVATVRSDSNRVLGIVGKDYSVLQNHEAFAFMDELVGTGEVRYESAGAMKDGRLIWLLARLPGRADVVDGDPQVPYVLLSTSHDGSAAVRIQPSFVRVVCWNTISVAWKENVKRFEETTWSIRHVGDMKSRIAAVRQAIGLVTNGFEAYIETAREMAARQITKDQFAEYVAAIFPEAKDADQSARSKNIVLQIVENYLADPRQKIKGVAGTAGNLEIAKGEALAMVTTGTDTAAKGAVSCELEAH